MEHKAAKADFFFPLGDARPPPPPASEGAGLVFLHPLHFDSTRRVP